ncbi:lachesin [Drosophila ficusphila]|uniref:lachesin n=1 Tax=Drosophila ficusphila TaxID=30025 RepID=UPI001C8A53EC|nr:lachesin [Drosophila ficusphila]XP_043063814.1 lachesin [Drosophila ficusphila]XP_043063815.1 lachesin [Drosophila ficusphila]
MFLPKLQQRGIAFGIVMLLIEAIGIIENHSVPHIKGISESDELGPEFLAKLSNITVPIGRDVSFTCVVDNLGQYRVAWIKSDSKAILGIHTHMVSLNPRLSVTHNGHNTWKLHISRVQINDSGSYMCQVNTDPMKSISGYLDVVVPPDILNDPEHNLEEGVSTEGGSISLLCSATGVPKPKVQWRRDAGKDIILRSESRDKQALKAVEGERLMLTNVHRSDMGAYNCIASNGIPPSVSKRYEVHVNFSPTIKAVNQLVGAPVEREVTLECIVEVYPKPLNGWYRNEGNIKLHNGNKYNISEEMINLYTWHLNLTIRYLTKSDFGAYSCSSVNALGKSESRIRLQELRLPPKSTTMTTPQMHTTGKPRRKQTPSHSKGLNEVVRSKETHFSNQVQQENDIYSGGIGVLQRTNSGGNGEVLNSENSMINGPEVHTHVPVRYGNEKTYEPGVIPSPITPWILRNAGSRRLAPPTKTSKALVILFCVLSPSTYMLLLL